MTVHVLGDVTLYRIDRVAGRKYYVGANEKGIAVVGPVRHRMGWRKKKNTKQSATVDQVVAPGSRLMTSEEMAMANAALPVLEMNGMKMVLPAFTPHPASPPQKPRGRLRSWLDAKRDGAEDKFWNPLWHQAVRHCALDVFAWSLTIVACISLGRLLLWVLSS